MNRPGHLVVAALAVAAVLVPTGAVPFDLTGTDRVSEDIALQPAEGPNGNYAVVNEDDELELLLTGSNPAIEGEGISSNAVTPIPRVFTMTYTGEQHVTVWLTDDAEDVRFYRGEDSDDSLEGRANSVVLGPNETVTVGLLVDTRGDHDVEQAETFTVNAEVAEGETSTSDTDGGGDVYSGEPDVLTPTGTDESGDPPTGTDESGDPPTVPDKSEGGPLPETPTESQSPTDSGTQSPTATDDSEGDGRTELGGGGLEPLLAIGGGLLVLLGALAAYRQVT